MGAKVNSLQNREISKDAQSISSFAGGLFITTSIGASYVSKSFVYTNSVNFDSIFRFISGILLKLPTIFTLLAFLERELEGCLLVLDSVTSAPQWIRQPKPRDGVHDVCVFVCKCVLGNSRAAQPLNIRLCLF